MTEKTFLGDPYQRECEARVLEVNDRFGSFWYLTRNLNDRRVLAR